MNTALSVLFLDDEPDVLEGIQRMLRHHRKTWEMEFISSVPTALQRIQAKEFDVVVSDMRMPAMDGATFLKQVQRLSPQTRRIILSGQSDEDSLVRSAVICHQYLAKPCTPEKLRESILRGNALRDKSDSSELRRSLVGCTCVASPAESVREIRKLFVGKSLPTFDNLENAILDDIGLFAKVLQIFCSSLFGTPIQPKDMRQILTEIGLENIQRIMSHGGVVSEVGNSKADLSFSTLNADSKRIAARARSIMIELEPSNTALQFLAYASGMLHAIGKCALWGQEPESKARDANIISLSSLEHQSNLSQDRAFIALTSSFLLDIWGLPTEVVKAVADTGLPFDTLDPKETVSVSLALSLLLEDVPQASTCESFAVAGGVNHSIIHGFIKRLDGQTQWSTGKAI